MTKKIQSIPEARLLLESLRSVGYNEETAIADIIFRLQKKCEYSSENIWLNALMSICTLVSRF